MPYSIKYSGNCCNKSIKSDESQAILQTMFEYQNAKPIPEENNSERTEVTNSLRTRR